MNTRPLRLQGAPVDSDRARARTNLTATGTFKTPPPTSTAKRTAGPLRPISGATKLSNDLAVVIGANSQGPSHTKPLKIITEVDGKECLINWFFLGVTRWISISLCSETNIDEVLNLADLSHVPTAFLTEIQQDQIYGTIFAELKKKIPQKSTSTSPPALLLSKGEESKQQQQEGNPPSAHPSSAGTGNRGEDDDDDDDDASLIDDIASTISSINNVLPSNDGYDTDIESGAVVRSSLQKSNSFFVQKLLFKKITIWLAKLNIATCVVSRRSFRVPISWHTFKTENWSCAIINSVPKIFVRSPKHFAYEQQAFLFVS